LCLDSAKIPPLILVPYEQGNKVLEYARDNKDGSNRAILFVDFDMVNILKIEILFLTSPLAKI
jgi:hypothetical protein